MIDQNLGKVFNEWHTTNGELITSNTDLKHMIYYGHSEKLPLPYTIELKPYTESFFPLLNEILSQGIAIQGFEVQPFTLSYIRRRTSGLFIYLVKERSVLPKTYEFSCKCYFVKSFSTKTANILNRELNKAFMEYLRFRGRVLLFLEK